MQIAKRIVASLSGYEVYTPNAEHVRSVNELQQATQLSFWDSMVAHSAVSLGCDMRYAEYRNAGQTIVGINIINPFDPLPLPSF